ncbi:MAG: D-aminoacyl-tRNA deacylase [Candidatus Thorarchaeota archaeon]
MRLLVTSEKDIASQTIKDVLLSDYGFDKTGETFEDHPVFALDDQLKLITTERDLIHTNHLEEHFDAEVFIFCSRHQSKSGRPSLLVHSTGNLGPEAKYGGEPYRLSVSTATLVRTAFKELYSQRNSKGLDEFDVSLEVTHHGPTEMDVPMLFVELGSDEEYWRHEGGAKAVTAAVMKCAEEPIGNSAYIGFGGTHYASIFNKLILTEDIAMSHIAPKYALSGLTPDVIALMAERSTEHVKAAIIDWKGTNSTQRDYLLPILEERGIELLRARDF